MSWFIERLLTNSTKILLRKTNSEMYEYLLTLEAKINDLKKLGILTEEELSLIEDLKNNKTITQLSKELGLSRVTTSTKIDDLTKKLSLYLGGIFTDSGYLNYMQRRYNLTYKQVKMLEEKIKSKYKRFYLR